MFNLTKIEALAVLQAIVSCESCTVSDNSRTQDQTISLQLQ